MQPVCCRNCTHLVSTLGKATMKFALLNIGEVTVVRDISVANVFRASVLQKLHVKLPYFMSCDIHSKLGIHLFKPHNLHQSMGKELAS